MDALANLRPEDRTLGADGRESQRGVYSQRRTAATADIDRFDLGTNGRRSERGIYGARCAHLEVALAEGAVEQRIRPIQPLPARAHGSKHLEQALRERVSTKNGQTVENQRQALTEAIDRRQGWLIVEEFVDHGISGAKGRDKRPAFDRLLKAVIRRKIDVVAAWSVDRLGRSLQDLIGFLGELNAAGVDLYLEKQAVDTTTPAGRALFQMLGVFAEFERAIIQERIHAGLTRAREMGTKSGKPIGRPPIDGRKTEQIRTELRKGTGILKTARLIGVGVSTVQRIKQETSAP